MIVTYQNVKNLKGYEYFCKPLYVCSLVAGVTSPTGQLHPTDLCIPVPWCSGPYTLVADCPETSLFVGLIILPAKWVKSSPFLQSRPKEKRTEGSSVSESIGALIAELYYQSFDIQNYFREEITL